jgi:ArsR family transcriptional regulator
MHNSLHSEDCARRLKALADPIRLKIIECLQFGPRNVTEIAGQLREELANVSHHLGILRQAGFVQDRKSGKQVFYCLHPEVFRPKDAGGGAAHLDLGCCRLELTNL